MTPAERAAVRERLRLGYAGRSVRRSLGAAKEDVAALLRALEEADLLFDLMVGALARARCMPSGGVSWRHPEANIYGCLPCPRCGGAHRYAVRAEEGHEVLCADCPWREPARFLDPGDPREGAAG